MLRDASGPPEPSRILPLIVCTLGRFAVWRDGELIEDGAWKRRKAKTLFKLLLLAPNRRVLREYVQDLLWPEQDPASASNNLHRTLFVLRRTLQPESSDAARSQYILVEHGAIALNPAAPVWVDSEEFEQLLRAARQQTDPLPTLERARGLYQGAFLPEDIYEDWAGGRRELLQTAFCDLLQEMARLYSLRADHSAAIDCLQRLLDVDPTNESGHRELMRTFTLAGHRHQALHQYQRARGILESELDVEPSPETTELYRAIVDNSWQPAMEIKSLPKGTLPASVSMPENRRRTALVGRNRELQRLRELVAQARSGRGTAVFLSGEQGVGKSRLAEEVTIYAGEMGMRVLSGAAYEQEGRLPYGPFVEAIRSGLAGRPQHTLHDMLGVAINDLSRLLPELGTPELERLLPELALRGQLRQSPELDVGQERQHLFDAVVTVLLALSQDSPLLLFLDDLHAADESTLQLLHYLARRLSDAPILFLCALREEEVPRGTQMARVFSELLRSRLSHRIHLARLSASAVAEMATDLLEGTVATGLSNALYQLSEGNPFFVHEVVLALREAEEIVNRQGVWDLVPGYDLFVPASVREVIDIRLETLTPDAYRLAAVASVAGREFSYDLLLAAAKLEDAVLLDLVDELMGARLIEETSSGYRFCHTLLRQTVYGGLSARRRIWLHGQVARALEQLAAHHLDERAAILAYHYERAEQYSSALGYVLRAGNRAQATNAPREAVEQYDHAWTLCAQHPQLGTEDTVRSLLECRAQAHLALSNFDGAISDLERLLDYSRSSVDRGREGEALYQAGIAHYWAHRLQQAATYLDRALQIAETLKDQALAAKVLKLRDILNSTQGGPAQASSVAAMGPTDNGRATPAEEHWGFALLAYLRSDFEIAIQHASACVELGESFPNPFLVQGGHFVLSMSRASLGQYQAALDGLLLAVDMSEVAGDRFWRARLLNTVGWVYRELFDVKRAVQYDEASLDLARNGAPRLTEAEGNALANLAADWLLLGDYPRARAYLEEGKGGHQDEQFMRWRYAMRMTVTRGWLELAEGRLDLALETAEELLAVARTTQAAKNVAQSCRLRGEVLLAKGQLQPAVAALRHALKTSLKIKSPALIWPCYLSLARAGEVDGKSEKARAHYLSAATIVRQVAEGLTDPALRSSFFSSPEIRQVYRGAGYPG